jgi:hypothetical protein
MKLYALHREGDNMPLSWVERLEVIQTLKEVKERELRKSYKEPNEHERHYRETGGRVYFPDPYRDKLIDFTEYLSNKSKDGA